jgi:hypothetical protein
MQLHRKQRAGVEGQSEAHHALVRGVYCVLKKELKITKKENSPILGTQQ